MKRTVRALATAAAVGTLLVGGTATASAADYVSVSPTTGVKAGDIITVTTTGLTGTTGVYASLCKAAASAQEAPKECDPDQTHMVWITGTGAQGSNKEVGKITAITSFTATSGTKVDCLVDSCVVYIRGDHNNGSNYALIRAFPVAFAAGVGGPVKKADVATATLDGAAAKPNVPGTLYYRVPANLVVTAASGLAVTLKSLTPDCSVEGTKITALTGTGVCAIQAVTAGNDVYAAFTAAVNFPFYLKPAPQTIVAKLGVKKLTVGKALAVKKAQVASNMEEAVSITSLTPRTCTVKETATGWTFTGKKPGVCKLQADSAGMLNKYFGGSLQFALTVKK